MNKNYEKRKMQGLCGVCGKRKAMQGKVSCETCAIKQRQWRKTKPGYGASTSKKWRNNNPERAKQVLSESRWRSIGIVGMTMELYTQMFEEQGGRCFLCGEPQPGKALAVDHDHKTGEPRKLLCSTCNLALERLENHNGWGHKAHAYLESYANGEQPND